MKDFRLRQVHLDFHTSPAIPDVGAAFDKDEWQRTIKLGHVDSITVFSKCHHGYSFHPSKVNEMHPTLKFDLLKAQLDACAEIGVKAPVYISAGYDEKDAIAHPEWLHRRKDDTNECGDFNRATFHLMCLNTGYLDKLLAEIEEVMQVYNPCEIFLDIVGERMCYCAKCRKDMADLGLSYLNEEDVKAFGKKVYRNYLDEVEKAVRKYSDTTVIFQNSGHLSKGRRDLVDTMAHLELESLPTGGWSYDHFPMSASYARTIREDYLGMTGKFHKTWGEFGGFKHPNALRYEAALSLAVGAGCSVGDQMHPNGKLNESTFRLIGAAYAEVEKKEPWSKDAKAVTDIAVLSTEIKGGAWFSDDVKPDVGANRILLESHRLYNFIDLDEDFNKYKLLILPDSWQFNKKLKAKVEDYLANGGKLLLSGVSGLDEDGNFCVDTGVKYLGKNEFSPTYYIPDFETVNGRTEYLMRSQSHLIEVDDAEVIAYGQNPYFNRTPDRFCSHQHAPNNPDSTYPAAVIKGNIAYISWDVFSGYGKFGDFHYKELAAYVIDRLMNGEFSLEASMPDRGVATLMEQGDRKIVHLLFAHTTNRGNDTEVIEDIVPLYNINVSVKCNKPEKVILAPQMQEISFEYSDGKVNFTVPQVNVHQIVSIE